jgi:serine phosphatase RsbU (regulator of sigma subunit)
MLFLSSALMLLLAGLVPSLDGQQPENHGQPDSLRVQELIAQAQLYKEEGEPTEALNVLGEALQMAMKQNMEQAEAVALELIGDVFISAGDAESSIPYYLRAASAREFAEDSAGIRVVYMKIGKAYSLAQVHQKAVEYYLKADQLVVDGDVEESLYLTDMLGTATLLSARPEEAIAHFLEYEAMLQEQGREPVPAWEQLVNAYSENENYDSCLTYTDKLLEHYGRQGDLAELALLHNNMGYYLTQLRRYEEALEHYALAMEHGEAAGIPWRELEVMKANMGICYQNMNEADDAKDHLNDAIGGLKGDFVSSERSRIENIVALIYYNEMDLYNAGHFCLEAISSAQIADDNKLLSDAYLTYSMVLRAGNDPENALKYYEMYLSLRDSLLLEERLHEQQLEDRIARLDRAERDLLLRLQEERVNELTINRLTLQLESEEQARELLERENDLRLLEQERLKQSMIIAEQQYKVEQQERENRILEQEQRIATMALEQEQQKQQEAAQEIRLLEQQQQLDQLEMEKQQEQRKALLGIVILMVLVVILVTAGLLNSRMKNALLARQKKEIESINRDLEQKNEEIGAQRDEIEAQRNLLFEQKEEIEQNNVEITNSIEYARHIQSSALPDLEVLREIASDYFLLFKPRDIVSGDFYWTARVEGITVLAVADCTGHGVPGAFMSMMGMSLLKEIVQKEYLTHPGVILRRLRKEVIRSLGQKGISGEQRDGMDISIIEINPTEKRIQYAGAYNSLYLIRDKQVQVPDIPEVKVIEGENGNGKVLYDIPADRMPVAYYDRMDRFTTVEINIEEGDQLYLYTDGYADQFGGESGKKLKYIPFKKLILENAGLPMDKQLSKLDLSLKEWQGDHDQIDDICLIGVRF